MRCAAAQARVAMLTDDGEDQVADSRRSMRAGRPAVAGALAAAPRGEAAAQAQTAGAAVKAACAAFTKNMVQRSEGPSAELLFALAWGVRVKRSVGRYSAQSRWSSTAVRQSVLPIRTRRVIIVLRAYQELQVQGHPSPLRGKAREALGERRTACPSQACAIGLVGSS